MTLSRLSSLIRKERYINAASERAQQEIMEERLRKYNAISLLKEILDCLDENGCGKLDECTMQRISAITTKI